MASFPAALTIRDKNYSNPKRILFRPRSSNRQEVAPPSAVTRYRGPFSFAHLKYLRDWRQIDNLRLEIDGQHLDSKRRVWLSFRSGIRLIILFSFLKKEKAFERKWWRVHVAFRKELDYKTFSNWNGTLQRSFSRPYIFVSFVFCYLCYHWTDIQRYIYIYSFRSTRGHFVIEAGVLRPCRAGSRRREKEWKEEEEEEEKVNDRSELFDRWKSNRWPWTVEVRLSRLRKPLPFNYRFIFIALLIITSSRTGRARVTAS